MRTVGILLVVGIFIWYLYTTGAFEAATVTMIGPDAPKPPVERGFEKSQLQGIVIVLCVYILFTSIFYKK
jgi:hypothetical protein